MRELDDRVVDKALVCALVYPGLIFIVDEWLLFFIFNELVVLSPIVSGS
jgi:hypothetical protein